MMNKLLRHAVCGLLAFGALSCARHTIIPDSELALIFRDAFLANAYISNENIRTDSLRIYEPIFARYGYTTEDVYYTIGNFSKRKSARLGDVVERAIDLLEAEGKVYNREVAILDTIDNVAQRTFTHTVYADCSRSNLYTVTLRRGREERFMRTFTPDTTHRRLRVDLLDFGQTPARPSVTVSDLKVTYTTPAADAVDSLYRRQLNIRIFADEFFRAAHPADSL